MDEPAQPPLKDIQESARIYSAVLADRLEQNLQAAPADRLSLTKLYALADTVAAQVGFSADPKAFKAYDNLRSSAFALGASPIEETKAITSFIRKELAIFEASPEPAKSQLDWLMASIDNTIPAQSDFAETVDIGLNGRLQALMDAKKKTPAPLPAIPIPAEPDVPLTPRRKIRAVTTLMAQALQDDIDTKKPTQGVSPLEISRLVDELVHNTVPDDTLQIAHMVERSLRYADPAEQRQAAVATLRKALGELDNIPDWQADINLARTLQQWMEKQLPTPGGYDEKIAEEMLAPTKMPPPPGFPPPGPMQDFQKKMQAAERVIASLANENIARAEKGTASIPADNVSAVADYLDSFTHGGVDKVVKARLAEARQYSEDDAYLRAVTNALRDTMAPASNLPGERIASRQFLELEEIMDRNFKQLLPPGASFAQLVEKEMSAPTALVDRLPVPEGAKIITPAQRLEALEAIVAGSVKSAVGQPQPVGGAAKLRSMAQNISRGLPAEVAGAFDQKLNAARAFSPRYEEERQALGALLRETMSELKSRNLPAAAVMKLQDSLYLDDDTNDKRVKDILATPKPLPGAPVKPDPAKRINSFDRLNALNTYIAEKIAAPPDPASSSENMLDLASKVVERVPGIMGQRLRQEMDAINRDGKSTDLQIRDYSASVIRRGMQQMVDRAETINSSVSTELQEAAFKAFGGEAMQEQNQKQLLALLNAPPAVLPPIPPSFDTSALPRLQDNMSFSSIARGVHDLSAELSPLDGGHREEGTWRMIGTPPKEKGEPRIVTYSFAGKDFEPSFGPAAELGIESAAAQAAARQAMDDIEKVANIRFVLAKPNEEAAADLQFGQAEMSNALGYSSLTPGGRTTVILQKSIIELTPEALARGESYYGTIVHEILHGLTLSHPGAEQEDKSKGGGLNEDYNTLLSTMSYHQLAAIHGLSPYDVITLITRYGPAPGLDQERTLQVDQAATTSTLIATGKTVSLDLRDDTIGGELHVDQSARMFGEQVKGDLTRGGKAIPLDNRVQPGTNVQAVADDTTKISLGLRGRKGASLGGGAGDDMLAAVGGANILRGGAGADMFLFGPESGKNNIITDFKPGDDRIIIRRGVDSVDFRASDKEGGGTELSLRQQGREVASVFIKGVSPEEVEKKMTLLSSSIVPDVTKNNPARPDAAETPSLRSMLNAGLEKIRESMNLPMADMPEPAQFRPPIPVPADPNKPDPGRGRP